MDNSIFLLTHDTRLIQRLKDAVSPWHHLLIGQSLDAARDVLRSVPARAVVAHVSQHTLNGHTPEAFFDDLSTMAQHAPTIVLIDDDCPRQLARRATQHFSTCLPVSQAATAVQELLGKVAHPSLASPVLVESGPNAALPHVAEDAASTTFDHPVAGQHLLAGDGRLAEVERSEAPHAARAWSGNGDRRPRNGRPIPPNENDRAPENGDAKQHRQRRGMPNTRSETHAEPDNVPTSPAHAVALNGGERRLLHETVGPEKTRSNGSSRRARGRQAKRSTKKRAGREHVGAATESEANPLRRTGTPRSRTLRGRTRSITTFTPAMFDVLDEVEVAARYDATVLLIGETGSGKTFLAHLLHELSDRADHPFCHVACGALPSDLIESELFGHVRGAFTGADRDREGKFAAVGKGTLLLDEIDVLSLAQQAKLLRVLESGQFEPVGSNETRRCDARLIVASNVDIQQLVDEGQFRSDLYFRLNVLKVSLPPLRERLEDLKFLTHQFVETFCQQHSIEPLRIAPEFLESLRAYDWPGNIRELENVVRRAVLYCRSGVLTPDDLPANISGKRAALASSPTTADIADRTLERQIDLFERRLIEESLQRNRNRRTATARELGISRVTLYNKMKKFGMLT